MVPGALNALLLAVAKAFAVTKSFLTRATAPTYFSRGFAAPTDGKKWTFSAWIRRTELYASRNNQAVLGLSTGSSCLGFGFANNGNEWGFNDQSTNKRYTNTAIAQTTTYVHVTVAYDSTQASDANRVKVWFGSTSIALTSPNAVTLNAASGINSNASHILLGPCGGVGASSEYISEICFVDGSVLDYSNFEDGLGNPKYPAVGEWGANGFYLDFKDGSSATALGYDKAPIGGLHTAANNWSPTSVLTSDQSTVVPP